MMHLKAIVCLLINFILAIVVGVGLLCLAYLLPVNGIEKHVAASAETIQNEGSYPAISKAFSSTLDNYTDSLILLEASNQTDTPVLKKAMTVYRESIDGYSNPAKTLVLHYIKGEAFNNTCDYPRYWHGYLIILKPLLELFNLHQIRIMNGVVQALLFLASCLLILKRKKDLYLIPWMLGYLMLMPVVLAKSLQYSSCFYITMIGSLLLLILSGQQLKKYGEVLFLNIGIALAFFDYLTYPIMTFGIPMAVFLMLDNESPIKNKLMDSLRYGLMWCIGYGGMWISKWILASWILGRDIVADGFSQFSLRTSSSVSDRSVTRIDVIAANYKEFFRTPAVYIMIICMLYLVYAIWKNRENISVEAWDSSGLYVLLGVAPVVWYCFAVNHSSVHTWFTNKACVVTVIAIMFGLINLAECDGGGTG